MDPFVALTVPEEERICLETLLNSGDILHAIQNVTWRPQSAIDLDPWIPVLEKIDCALMNCLKDHPSLLCTADFDPNISLDHVETSILEAVGFLGHLLSWSTRRKAYTAYGFLEPLLRARNEQLMTAVLDLLAAYCGVGPMQWQHRLVATRWYRSPKERLSLSSLDDRTKLQETLTTIAVYEGTRDENDYSDEDDDGMEVQTLRVRQNTPVCAEQESIELKQASGKLMNSVGSSVSAFDRFKMLLVERRKASNGFFLVRDACFVLFTSPGAREQDLHAAARVLDVISGLSAKLIVNSLASKIPGRGILIESVRNYLAQADADPETRLGLSFARVAERRSTKDFWLRLEMQLRLCGLVTVSESGLAALIDGGVMRAIVSWLKRTVADEDDMEMEEGNAEKCFVISAGCFFYLSLALTTSISAIQPTEDGEVWIKGCLKLAKKIRDKSGVPSFAERTVLCALITAIRASSQASRKANNLARVPPFAITEENAPLTELLVLLLRNASKLGGAAIRSTAELLTEVVRGLPVEPVVHGPIGQAVIDLVEHWDERCPSEDVEALFAAPKLFWQFLRKSGFGRTELLRCSPFTSLLKILRDPRFFPVLAGPHNDVQDALRDFLNDALDMATGFATDTKESLTQILLMQNGAEKSIALANTLKCVWEALTVRDVARKFLESDGVSLLLSFVSMRNEEFLNSKKTLDLVYSCIRGLAMTSRRETLEALAKFVRQVIPGDLMTLGVDGTEFTQWLMDILGGLISPAGTRGYQPRASGLFSDEVTILAFEDLAKWDARREYPSLAYHRFLAVLVKNSRTTSSSGFGAPASGRSRADRRMMDHLVWVLQSIILDEEMKDRALARAYTILTLVQEGGGLDEVLRVLLYESRITHRLVDISSEALNRSDLAHIGARLLGILLDEKSMKAADWGNVSSSGLSAEAAFASAHLDLSVYVAERLSNIDLSKLMDATLLVLTKVIAQLLVPSRSWRPPKKETAQPTWPKQDSKPQFVPSREIVPHLMDMGFHGAHIQAAQEKLRSNDVQELTLYLLENTRPVTEEDEIKFAMWLSMGDEETASSDAAKPELSLEEVKEKEEADQTEARSMQTIARLREHFLASCPRLGTVRSTVILPFEVVVACGPRPARNASPVVTVSSPVWTIVYFRNESSSVFKVSSSQGKSSPSMIVQPFSVVPFHTFVSSELTVWRKDERQNGEFEAIGSVESRLAFVEVVIPAEFDFNLKRCLVGDLFSELPVTPKPIADVDPSAMEVEAHPMVFVNDTEFAIELIPSLADDLTGRYASAFSPMVAPSTSRFTLRPGEQTTRQFRKDLVWYGSPVPTRDQWGLFDCDYSEEGNIQYVLLLSTGLRLATKHSTFFTMIARNAILKTLDKDKTDANTFLGRFQDNPPLLAEILQQFAGVSGAWKAWLGALDSAKLFQVLINHLIAPVYSHHSSARHIQVEISDSSSPTKGGTSAKKRAADEAELGEEITLGGSKKKRNAPPPLAPSMGESPARARIIFALGLLLELHPTIEDIDEAFRKIADSLGRFNAFEADAALHLLQSKASQFLTLQMIMNVIHVHGFLPSAARCVELLLRVPEDEQYVFRRRAYVQFRKLCQQQQRRSQSASVSNSTETATNPNMPKLSLDAFCSALDLQGDDIEKSAQALRDYVIVEGDKVVNCRKPEMDECVGLSLVEEFLDLVERQFEPETSAGLLANIVSKLPRVVPAMSRRESLLERLLGVILSQYGNTNAPSFVSKIDLVNVCMMLQKCASASEEARKLIAKRLVAAVASSPIASGWTFFVALTLLRASPKLIIACDQEKINHAILTRLHEPASPALTDLLALFHFLVSREVRALVAQAPSSGEVEDDLVESDEAIMTMLERELRPRRTSSDGGGGDGEPPEPSALGEIEEMMLFEEMVRMRRRETPREMRHRIIRGMHRGGATGEVVPPELEEMLRLAEPSGGGGISFVFRRGAIAPSDRSRGVGNIFTNILDVPRVGREVFATGARGSIVSAMFPDSADEEESGMLSDRRQALWPPFGGRSRTPEVDVADRQLPWEHGTPAEGDGTRAPASSSRRDEDRRLLRQLLHQHQRPIPPLAAGASGASDVRASEEEKTNQDQ